MSGFSPATPAPHRSLWLEQALDRSAPTRPRWASRPPPTCASSEAASWDCGRRGGSSSSAPDCDVVVLERDICGGGASGRNGGFVLSWWAKFPSLLKLSATDVAAPSAASRNERSTRSRLLPRARSRHPDRPRWVAVDEPHRRRHGRRGRAPSRAARGESRAFVELAARRGRPPSGGRPHTSAGRLTRAEPPSSRPSSPAGCGGPAWPPGCGCTSTAGAALHPAAPGRRPHRHGHGHGRPPVIATNAWSAGIPELRRHLVAISSDVVATDPMPDAARPDRLDRGRGDHRFTADGGLLPHHPRRPHRLRQGRLGDRSGRSDSASFDRNEARSHAVESDLHDAYPNLPGMRVAAHWSGPIDRSTDGLPMLGELGGHSTSCTAWAGAGTASARRWRAAGRSPTGARPGRHHRAGGAVESPGRQVPARPAQIRGAHLVREAVRRKEQAEQAGRRPNRLFVKLSQLVPAGLEDH